VPYKGTAASRRQAKRVIQCRSVPLLTSWYCTSTYLQAAGHWRGGLEAEICETVRELGLLGLRFRVWPFLPSCTLLKQSSHHTACTLINGGSCVADRQTSEDEPEVPVLPQLTQNHGGTTHARWLSQCIAYSEVLPTPVRRVQSSPVQSSPVHQSSSPVQCHKHHEPKLRC
jgi:hypothetical protein